MCSEGPETVFELDIWGYHFQDLRMEEYIKDHLADSQKFGEGGRAARTCAAADRTGHALLHSLSSKSKSRNKFFK